MNKLVIMAVVVALLSGCATDNVQRILSADRATYKNVGISPALGSFSVVDVGEKIAEQFAYDVYFDSKTVDSFDGRLFLGNVKVPAGEKLRAVEAADGSLQFCSTRNLYFDPLTGPYDIVCFADTDDDLSFEKMRVPAIASGQWKIIESPIAYQRGIVDMPVGVATGYKTELIYQGLSDGDIKIAYHEYVNNMARPSFSQMVDYKYSMGEALIAFKGARITVHEATSSNLTYTLDKGFDSYVKRDEDLSIGEDLFVGKETALITGLGRAGFFNSWNNCAVGRIVPPDLSTSIFNEPRMSSVIGGDSYVVGAGPIKILALCTFSDPFGDYHSKAWFNFVAEVGHTYTFAFSKSADCLNLLDVTTDGQIVACAPYFSGRYVDLSTGDDTAIVRTWGASSNKGDCHKLKSAAFRGFNAGFLLVDAGPLTVDVSCSAYVGFVERTSSFDFVAVTGHTYIFTDSDMKCIRLLDITFEETVISCEPYQKSE